MLVRVVVLNLETFPADNLHWVGDLLDNLSFFIKKEGNLTQKIIE
jgi:hypothetical protein